AAAHARRILRASRGTKHRVTLNEAAVAEVICACKESRHPYILKRVAEAVGMDPNGVYRLLAWAIEEAVPKMTWYSTGIPDKIRKLKETGKPEEFMYVSP
ncbi:hypothetical protein J7L18_09350, partial [Candidatus Bathyarchaeota archaeon]|nr:hypothetical protein [Candidatus Bathyarchaeota archaeon]